ncbi:hypothetical protein [Luteolibacter soli]|uniref:DUF4034 domain-containing protein n=1 Tax=Luteolibacter soli TaxID=3135280 RepID=A0ABU9AWZ5_9BACT
MARSKTKTVIFRCAGIVVLAGLAWVGSRAGHYMARGGWFQGETVRGKVARGLQAAPERTASAPVKAADVASVVRRLQAIAKGSPNLLIDFEAGAQIDAILAKLSAGELAAVFDGLDSGAARRDYNMRALILKVGVAWVVLDPTAAMTAAAGKSTAMGGDYSSNIFGEWAADAPEAAFAWLNGEDFPASLEKMKDELRSSALFNLAERDFDVAKAEFLKMGDEKQGWQSGSRASVLRYWGSMYLDDPGMRDQLVEFAKSTGKPDDYARLNDALLREWKQEDPLGMLEYLQGLKDYLESDAVPAEKRQEVDASAVNAAIYREYTGQAMEWWMSRYSQSTETPQRMREAIGYWIHQRPAEMEQWFAEQPESPQRDAMSAAAAITYTGNGKFQEAAKRVGEISDATMKQSAVERLNYVWSQQDAKAAAEWRGR